MSAEQPRPQPWVSPGSCSCLSAGLRINGEISGNEDLVVNGRVEGSIRLEGRSVTVGTDAKVTADILAREVVVYGNLSGPVKARDRIEIKKEGSVIGDLTTGHILVEDGAYFKGSIEIDTSASEMSSATQRTTAPSATTAKAQAVAAKSS